MENVIKNEPTETPEVFYVEDILSQRMRGGRLEYYIKWEGYGMEDCTWEPAANINCWDIIKKFKQKLKEQKQKEKAGLKKELKRKNHVSKSSEYNTTVDVDTNAGAEIKKPKACDDTTIDVDITKETKKPKASSIDDGAEIKKKKKLKASSTDARTEIEIKKKKKPKAFSTDGTADIIKKKAKKPKTSSLTSDCADIKKEKRPHPSKLSSVTEKEPSKSSSVTNEGPKSNSKKENQRSKEVELQFAVKSKPIQVQDDVESAMENLFRGDLSRISATKAGIDTSKPTSPNISQEDKEDKWTDMKTSENDDDDNSYNNDDKENILDNRNGFEKGWSCKALIGGVKKNAEVWFLVKYKNHEEVELLPSKICSVYCPLKVISFYEKRLSWNSTSRAAAIHAENQEEIIVNAEMETS